MKPNELANLLLSTTQNGKDLSDSHRKVIEEASAGSVTADTIKLMNRVYRELLKGKYRKQPAAGISGRPNMTLSASGNLRWKDVEIEALPAANTEEIVAELARRCELLEAKGFPVTARTVQQVECYDAPADTPWKKALVSYYRFLKMDGNVVGIFYRDKARPGEPAVVSAYKDVESGSIHLGLYPTAWDAYHTLRYMGHMFEPVQSYADALVPLEGLNLTPAEVERAISVVF